MAEPQAEAQIQPWRSDQIAVAAAIAAVATPIAFMLFGWFAGAFIAALAAAISVVVLFMLRLERVELERRAQEAEAEARAQGEAQTRFFHVLSHDLRQPIHALSLYTAALAKRIESPEARGIIEKIDRAALASAEMISRIDAYARFASKTIEPNFETCALQPILAQVSTTYPSVTAPETTLHVRTDATLLRATLDRLAENAERYAGGGRIELREVDDDVEITVADEGRGIPAEEQERVFEHFVRLSGGKAEGLGLGLPIARRLARLIGTDVRLESSPESGTRVSVRVPIVGPSAT